jgi:hypothetical protein
LYSYLFSSQQLAVNIYLKTSNLGIVGVLFSSGGNLWRTVRTILRFILFHLNEFPREGQTDLTVGWTNKSVLGEPGNGSGFVTIDIVAAFLHAQFKPKDVVTYIKIIGGLNQRLPNPYAPALTFKIRTKTYTDSLEFCNPKICQKITQSNPHSRF